MLPIRFASCVLVIASVSLAGCPRPVSPADVPEATEDAVDVTDAQPDIELPDVRPDVPPLDMGTGRSGIGQPCTGESGMPVQGDCADGQLCLTDQFGFNGGYCTQQCGAAGSPCPADAACVRAGGQFDICLQRCRSGTDCRPSEGYACRPSGTGTNVCVPTDGPVGTRDGEACYTTTAGPHQIPDTAIRTFASGNLSVSSERSDSFGEAEGNVVSNPMMSSTIAISYIAIGGGTSFMGSSLTPDGTAITRTGRATDPTNPTTSDPVLVYTRDGRLHMVFLGYRQGSDGQPALMRLRIADSTDNGATWGVARGVDPAGYCSAAGILCDKPWIVAGPAPGGTGMENLYIGYMRRAGMSIELVSQRSEDGGMTWSAPARIGGVENVGGSTVLPNLLTLAVAPEGDLHVTYAGLGATGGTSARYGAAGNRIAYRRSADGGQTWSPVRAVSSGTSDSVVYNQPAIALDGTSIHVVYTSGVPSGAWDIMLSTSTDGGVSWRRRKVNDEPDACATHFQPWIVADTTRHLVHATWLDNRFGEGELAYAACPNDAAMPCAANERVSSMNFTLATARDPQRWHGDYSGIAISGSGQLWAGWSDTRTGSPAMYLARGIVP